MSGSQANINVVYLKIFLKWNCQERVAKKKNIKILIIIVAL